MAKTKKKSPASIAQNKRARYDYFVEDTIEAGMVLEGWEVKSIRDGRVQINESYAYVQNGECFISGAHITPLMSASTHINPEATRVRKLLLHREEIDKLMGAVDRKGYTLLALSLYWKQGKVKLQLGLGKGKKQHDKRATEKERDWAREKARVLKP